MITELADDLIDRLCVHSARERMESFSWRPIRSNRSGGRRLSSYSLSWRRRPDGCRSGGRSHPRRSEARGNRCSRRTNAKWGAPFRRCVPGGAGRNARIISATAASYKFVLPQRSPRPFSATSRLRRSDEETFDGGGGRHAQVVVAVNRDRDVLGKSVHDLFHLVHVQHRMIAFHRVRQVDRRRAPLPRPPSAHRSQKPILSAQSPKCSALYSMSPLPPISF